MITLFTGVSFAISFKFIMGLSCVSDVSSKVVHYIGVMSGSMCMSLDILRQTDTATASPRPGEVDDML